MNTKLISLATVLLFLAGCVPPTETNENVGQKPAQQITTDVVKRQDLIGYTFFDGKLVVPESARAAAFSPYDTTVLSVSTSLGKRVGRGEPIVKMTIPGADAAAAAAKANVNSAKADYSAQKVDNSAALREAQRGLAVARAAEKSARVTVANGGQADIESATQDRIAAEAAVAQAQQELRASLQPNKEAINQAAAALASAKADAAKGIVRAPISGIVVSLDAKPGLGVTSRQPLATIINFNLVRVQGLVPPELKDLVVKDSHVIIAMTGPSSDPLDGLVLDVSVAPPSAGQKAPGYLAVIEFLNPAAIVQPMISVKRIGVRTGEAKDVLVVPVGAVYMKDGKSKVNVKSGDTWVETTVETGITDGALVEIKSGLENGATISVVTQPQAVQKI